MLSNHTHYNLSELEPHPANDRIYGDSDEIDGLRESVEKRGVRQPIVITPGKTIVSGHRRVNAADAVGLDSVPAIVSEFEDELAVREAIVEYNLQRDKTYRQRMREADELEEIERERAGRRQGDRTDLRDTCPEGGGPEYGRARDKIAERIGSSSGKTYWRERQVWEAAEEGDPIAEHEVDRLNQGDSTPYNSYSCIQNRDPDDGEDSDDDSEPEDTLDADDLILSAKVGSNAEVFPDVLELHVDPGAVIADVTYGHGSFWRNVPADAYDLRLTDIDPERSPDTEEGVDYRDLPYEDNSIDAVVLDPPYAEGFYDGDRSAGESDYWIKGRYANASEGDLTYHEAVLHEYFVAAQEARRVLVDDGMLIVKLQDEVSRDEQRLTHIEVTNRYEQELDLSARDLFVVVREGTPSPGRIKRQRRARKNHSYFMVFVNRA